VEKTDELYEYEAISEKHLHGRGEDSLILRHSRAAAETPPRAWRRLYVLADKSRRFRNTSTGVEKTTTFSYENFTCEKHLHGRGEDRN